MKESLADINARFWAIVERIEAGDPAYARQPIAHQAQEKPAKAG